MYPDGLQLLIPGQILRYNCELFHYDGNCQYRISPSLCYLCRPSCRMRFCTEWCPYHLCILLASEGESTSCILASKITLSLLMKQFAFLKTTEFYKKAQNLHARQTWGGHLLYWQSTKKTFTVYSGILILGSLFSIDATGDSTTSHDLIDHPIHGVMIQLFGMQISHIL